MPFQGRFQNNRNNGRRFSISPIRRCRSRSPDRRRSPFRKLSPKTKRKSPARKTSRSPRRRVSRSPVTRNSFQSPNRRVSRSPNRRISRSPNRRVPRSPNRRISRSPIRRVSRSPIRRVSRSPVRRSRSPVKRLSRSPIRNKTNLSLSPRRHISRSPVRMLSSPSRRLSSPRRDRNGGRKQRSRSGSRSRNREDRFSQRSPDLSSDRFNRKKPEESRKSRRSLSNSPRRSPRRSPNYSRRNIADRLGPISPNPGPKIIRDTSSLNKIEPFILRKRTLNERFRTADDGHFRIDENITIGIQRNPYAPASTSITVQKVFDPHLFHMIHNRDSGLLPIFDRPELKYFHFDDMPHNDEEPTFERRTIKVAPPTSQSTDSRYGHIHLSRSSPSPRRRSPSPRRRSPSPRRRSPSPRRRSPSPKRRTEVKLEMKTDLRYEKLYQDTKYEDRFSKVISNPNDLRHNLSNRHVEDARYRIEGKREDREDNSRTSRSRERKKSQSHTPVRNQGRNNHGKKKDNRNKPSTNEDADLPDFSRRPDRSKYQPWVDNPTKIPKGITYFQSCGKAKIIQYIEGYIVGVTAKCRSHREVEQFYFRLYLEKTFIHGISFNPNLWATLKTMDGSTCLGVVFRRAKLRPPRLHKPWNLVIDRFTKIETKLMPFPMHLETDERKVVKAKPGKTADLYADEESYDLADAVDEEDADGGKDESLDQVSEEEFTSITEAKEGTVPKTESDSEWMGGFSKSESMPIKTELKGIPPENPILKGIFPLKPDFLQNPSPKKKDTNTFRFLKKNRSYRKRELSPTDSKPKSKKFVRRY